jgi:hypothetical protein
VVYSILLYVKIEFSWEIENFLWFYFFIFTAFMHFTLYGMMIVALTPGHQIAATCCLASSSPEQCVLPMNFYVVPNAYLGYCKKKTET